MGAPPPIAGPQSQPHLGLIPLLLMLCLHTCDIPPDCGLHSAGVCFPTLPFSMELSLYAFSCEMFAVSVSGCFCSKLPYK